MIISKACHRGVKSRAMEPRCACERLPAIAARQSPFWPVTPPVHTFTRRSENAGTRDRKAEDMRTAAFAHGMAEVEDRKMVRHESAVLLTAVLAEERDKLTVEKPLT